MDFAFDRLFLAKACEPFPELHPDHSCNPRQPILWPPLRS
jgi:hypothetical protein